MYGDLLTHVALVAAICGYMHYSYFVRLNRQGRSNVLYAAYIMGAMRITVAAVTAAAAVRSISDDHRH